MATTVYERENCIAESSYPLVSARAGIRELPAINGDVLSRGFHHPKSRDKTSNTIT